MCTLMFIIALFMKTKTRETANYLSVDEWIKKMWNGRLLSHTMEGSADTGYNVDDP